ncbi:MAG: S8 family serine peptidase [Bacteroidota bacterium]
MQLRAINDTELWPKADSSTGLARAKLYKGQLWTIQKEVKGKAINGNDRWYQDALGNFLWSGDLEVVGTAAQNAANARKRLPKAIIEPAGAKLPEFKMDWPIVQLDIDRIWPYSMGEGVRIAILDSGLYEAHIEINPKYIAARKNFVSNSSKVTDTQGHGTQCAGLIAAQGKRLFGIAPGANLLIGKVINSQAVKEKKLLDGIEWAIEQGAHIISISLFMTAASVSDDFKTKVSQLIKEKGVLIFAAVGNNTARKEINNVPACIKGVVGIGSYGKDGKLDSFTTRTPNLDFFVPGKDVFTLGIKQHAYCRERGTSMATAIASGLSALLLSPLLQQNPKYRPLDILPLLRQYTSGNLAFAPQSPPNDRPKPKPKPNPLLAFQKTFPTHVT